MSIFVDLKALIETMPESSGFNFVEFWRDDNTNKKERYIQLQSNGGLTTTFERASVDIRFISAVSDNNVLEFVDKTTEISRKLSQTTTASGCIFKVIVDASAGSPRLMNDGRYIVNMSVTVYNSTGYNI